MGNRRPGRALRKQFRAALRIQPGVAEWRLNLGRALASQGELAEGRFQMEESVRLKPDYAEARVDYARVLAQMNRLADAEKQAKLAVDADPRSTAAHELWGSLLASKGDAFRLEARVVRSGAASASEYGARKWNWGRFSPARGTVPMQCCI